MKQHSALNRGLMMDWIERCAESGEPMPDDAAIADRFGFEAEELARTLLADLADKGLISIVGAGPLREIRLGRISKYRAPHAEPMRTIVRPETRTSAGTARGVSRIMEIARRRVEVPAPAPTPDPEPLVRLERKPLVRAAMVAAAQRDGFAVDVFVRILLERGFQSYEADAAAERAA